LPVYFLFLFSFCHVILILFILAFEIFLDPVSLVCDDKIKKELSACGISVQSFNGDLLYEPWDIYDENGHAFTNFRMYWEKCMKLSILSPSFGPLGLISVPGNFWPIP
jgi:deoxyribodipyrimidine photolyase